MTVRPSDFATYKEALAYANTQLDEWKEKFRELEADMIFLSEEPPSEDIRRIETKWKVRAAKLQEVKA